jgi:hypothetical protein
LYKHLLSLGTSFFIPSHRSLPQSFEPIYDWGNAYGAIAVTVDWIQECAEKPMFHLQSQWSPETHPLPVLSA